jgi:hypothetical protein
MATRKIRRNVIVFMNGSLQKVDLDETGRVVPKGEVKEKVGDEDKNPTKQELMAELKKRGISFKATLGNAALTEILEADDKAKEEPPKGEENPGGTGNQDVI